MSMPDAAPLPFRLLHLWGRSPAPWLFTNLHSLAVEGLVRRHLLLSGLAALGLLALGAVEVRLLVLVGALSVALLLLGLTLMGARALSPRLGLEALILVPTPWRLAAWLGARRGFALPGSPGSTVLDLHVDSSRRFAGPDALHEALGRDVARLVAWGAEGRFGQAPVLLLNTFNRRLVAMLAAASPGAVQREGCVLLQESVDAHGEAFIAALQEELFGRVLEPRRGRDDVRLWQLIAVQLPG